MFFTILLAAAITVVHGRQADVTTSALVHSPKQVTLTLEVELKPGVHVYAPGVEDTYIPIAWTLAESPGYKAGDARMPPSRKLYLEAIDETVPVYEGRFRLTRDVDLNAPGAVEIEGTFRYQACDDQMCYKPEKLTLHWSLDTAHQ